MFRARTEVIGDPGPLLSYADPRGPLAWMREGDGIVGIGEAARYTFHGPGRVQAAAQCWRSVVAGADIRDAVRLPGSGLLAFGVFTFADDSDRASTLVVPQMVIGRRNGTAWLTQISADGAGLTDPACVPVPHPSEPTVHVALTPHDLPPDAFTAAVAAARTRIRAGMVQKVVLSRTLRGALPPDAVLTPTLERLAADYPDTWLFAVDGLLGASPETLARVSAGTVTSRILAGTSARIARPSDPALSRPIHPTPTADPVCPALTTDPDDAALALTLQHSAKDRAEHALAVASVIEVLAPHIVDLRVDPEPFALRLPNVWHLATDLSGRLADESTVLDLVAKLHPTAAVGGTPTAAAIAAITDLESFDRGRYAGPVGWIDASGDGEWAVAIRCAQVDPDGTVTAYAGCGVVAASDPATELTETDWKFGPIRAAFAPVTDVPSRNTTQG